MDPEMDLPGPSFHRRARLASWRRLPPLWQTKPWTDQTKIVNTCNLPNLVPLVIIWKTVDRISDIWRHWAFSFAWQNRYIVFHSKTGLVQTLANYSTRSCYWKITLYSAIIWGWIVVCIMTWLLFDLDIRVLVFASRSNLELGPRFAWIWSGIQIQFENWTFSYVF